MWASRSTRVRRNRLYKGDGKGAFCRCGREGGRERLGGRRGSRRLWTSTTTGRPDLFVAFREKESRLYRNDGDHFTEVAKSMGITGARNTVGAVLAGL